MSEPDQTPSNNIESVAESAHAIGGLASTLVAGVPSSVSKSAISAINHLIGAAVEIPTAHLRGIAANITANYDERIRIKQEVGRQMSAGVKVQPNHSDVAMLQHVQQINRISLNKMAIVGEAIEYLRVEPKLLPETGVDLRVDPVPVQEVSKDWLNVFEDLAGKMSTDGMRTRFAKILAEEIRKPSTFSIRTLNIVAQLDNKPARLFSRLCTMACQVKYKGVNDVRIVSDGDARGNTLRKFGFSLEELSILQEYGLVYPQYDTAINYAEMVNYAGREEINPFSYRRKSYCLEPYVQWIPGRPVDVQGVVLTEVGKELYEVVDLEDEIFEFPKYLEQYFSNRGVKMVKINDNSPE